MVADHVSVKLQDGVELSELQRLTRDFSFHVRKSYQHADIVAPYSTYSTSDWDSAYAGDSYGYSQGASMSSPLVAGSAAFKAVKDMTLRT